VPSSQIHNLRDAEATRAAIIGAFCDLRNDSRIQNGDPILIYFAGHGGECDVPAGWAAGGSKIQMLIPYDFGTEINNCNVHGIPDRTVAALLDRLAKEKGDNIVGPISFTYTAHADYATDHHI
jgi:Caspase domain